MTPLANWPATARNYLAAPPDSPVGIELAGRRYNQFEFIRPLGAGGFGEVWLTRDHEMQRWVATKFLHSRDQNHRQRLVHEAQASARIRDDHVVTVHQVVDIEDLKKAAIVMELCWDPSAGTGPPTGQELAIPLARAPRSPKTNYHFIAARMRLIASAVGAAHTLGVIHGDLKPENVLVTPNGRLFVTDFGLGMAGSVQAPGDRSGNSSISVPGPNGEIHGTPCYMAPEQATGQRATLRSDVYSLGATLFFLLAGRTPYGGQSDTDIIRKVSTEPPAPLPKSVPRGLARICLKAMSLKPEARYEDANVLTRALQRWQLTNRLLRVSKVTSAVLALGLMVLTVTQLLSRHAAFDGGPDDSVVIQRGLPWFRFPTPEKRLNDTGLIADDIEPSKRSALVGSHLWTFNRPDSDRFRALLSNLRPSSELRWRAYCGDWRGAAALNRKAWAGQLSEPEILPTRDAWSKLVPLAPASAIPVVVAHLSDPSELLRENAIVSLGIVGKHNPQEAVTTLVGVFKSETAHQLRWSAISAVGEVGSRGPEPALTFLVSVAQDKGNDFGEAAAMARNAVAKSHPAEVARAVAGMLNDKDSDVVQRAA